MKLLRASSEDYCTFGRGKLATTLTASSHRCPTNAHSMHEFEIFLYSRDDETSLVNRFSLFFLKYSRSDSSSLRNLLLPSSIFTPFSLEQDNKRIT